MPRRTFREVDARRVIIIERNRITVYVDFRRRDMTVPAPEPPWAVGAADDRPPDVRRYELGFAPVAELEARDDQKHKD